MQTLTFRKILQVETIFLTLQCIAHSWAGIMAPRFKCKLDIKLIYLSGLVTWITILGMVQPFNWFVIDKWESSGYLVTNKDVIWHILFDKNLFCLRILPILDVLDVRKRFWFVLRFLSIAFLSKLLWGIQHFDCYFLKALSHQNYPTTNFSGLRKINALDTGGLISLDWYLWFHGNVCIERFHNRKQTCMHIHTFQHSCCFEPKFFRWLWKIEMEICVKLDRGSAEGGGGSIFVWHSPNACVRLFGYNE